MGFAKWRYNELTIYKTTSGQKFSILCFTNDASYANTPSSDGMWNYLKMHEMKLTEKLVVFPSGPWLLQSSSRKP